MPAAQQNAWSRMTLDEFLLWNAPRPMQLVDGEPQAMAPATEIHGLLKAELVALLRNHLLDQRSACRVVTAPGVVPRVRSDVNFRIPDLGVTCSPPSQSAVVAEPVLLIEILSPSNEVDTRANVWAYTTIPSVQEILLLRSSRIEAELLRRGPDGSWPAGPMMLGPEATLTLDSLGFTVALAAVYRTTGLSGLIPTIG
jgi:Uma2 family endonuclease